MNDFIVWDELEKKFIPYVELLKDDDNHISYFDLIKDMCFYDIGIKDINDNHIYADSSIVEFEYDGEKIKGYFRFDDFELRYKIVISSIFIFGGINKLNTIDYSQDCKNFEIIDTIQENKLGLIK